VAFNNPGNKNLINLHVYLKRRRLKMNKDQISGIAIGLAVGAAIGLAIGFLYAPKSGNETRKLVKEKALDIKEKAAAAVSKIKVHAMSHNGTKDQ
jgi:gas vesicle protein